MEEKEGRSTSSGRRDGHGRGCERPKPRKGANKSQTERHHFIWSPRGRCAAPLRSALPLCHHSERSGGVPRGESRRGPIRGLSLLRCPEPEIDADRRSSSHRSMFRELQMLCLWTGGGCLAAGIWAKMQNKRKRNGIFLQSAEWTTKTKRGNEP